MKTSDALLVLVILAVIGLGLYVVNDLFRAHYQYFAFGGIYGD